MCENSKHYGTDKKGNDLECGDMFNCCDCGTREEGVGCGCSYCFSCNACETCINDNDN